MCIRDSNKWEDIIIDVGGRDTGALRAALLVCDILLVPVQPRSYDVWALSKLEDIIRDARDIGADFDAYCFLSCADSQGADNQEAAEVMKFLRKRSKLRSLFQNRFYIPLMRRRTNWGFLVPLILMLQFPLP